jgi:microcin C transport system permease protein
MPLVRVGPNESLFDLTGSPPNPPSNAPFGTDDRGRDVLVRLAYGFNISMTFALLVTLVSGNFTGIAAGASLGCFGGRVDILGHAGGIEIWSSLRSSTSSSSSARSSSRCTAWRAIS